MASVGGSSYTSERWRSAAPLTLQVVIHRPITWAIAGLLLVGQLLAAVRVDPATPRDVALLLLAIALQTAVLASLAGLVCGLVERYAPRWAAALWMTCLLAATAFLWDDFSQQWVGLHIVESLPLLVWNARSDFLVMRSKLFALCLGLFAYVATLVLGTFALAQRRVPGFGSPEPARTLAAFFLLSAGLVLLEHGLAPYVMTAPAYAARRDRLWELPLPRREAVGARPPLFVIEAPRFRQLPDEREVEAVLAEIGPGSVRRPLNVFLFVVEGLRQDQISEDVAPHLWRLQHEALPILGAASSSNCTHISWFSLSHGVNPLFWSVVAHQAHAYGSAPIRMLRKAGYSINAFSSPRLAYWDFARSVFGQGLSLASRTVDQDSILKEMPDAGVGEIDERVMDHLLAALDRLEPEERAFYVLLFDAPHHGYHWSKEYVPRFQPFSESASLFPSGIPSSDVGLLRNRYKNSVNFFDGLFGRFLERLRSRQLLGSSLIVVTGDHGEEFLDRGHLVHSSALNQYQLRVPMIVFVPDELRAGLGAPRLTHHMDVFPTILEAVGLGDASARLLSGRSLLRPGLASFALSAQCSTSSPDELLLDAGENKLLVEFDGIAKVGRALYARRLTAAKLLDRNFDELPRRQPESSDPRREFAPILGSFLQPD